MTNQTRLQKIPNEHVNDCFPIVHPDGFRGFIDNLIRIDFSASASHQSDQDIEYEYNDTEELHLPGGIDLPAEKGTARPAVRMAHDGDL